jgi:hypothetical protein
MDMAGLKKGLKVAKLKELIKKGTTKEEIVEIMGEMPVSYIESIAYKLSIQENKVFQVAGLKKKDAYINDNGSIIMGAGTVETTGFDVGTTFKVSATPKTIVLTKIDE